MVRRPRVRDLDKRFESQSVAVVHATHPGSERSAARSVTAWARQRRLLNWPCAGYWASRRRCRRAQWRTKEPWQAEYSERQQRRIDDETVYLWLNGVYLKAVLEKGNTALLVAIGVNRTAVRRCWR